MGIGSHVVSLPCDQFGSLLSGDLENQGLQCTLSARRAIMTGTTKIWYEGCFWGHVKKAVFCLSMQ